MAKAVKPSEKPSPFNALLAIRRPEEQHLEAETSKHLDIQTASGLAKSNDPEFIKFTTYIRKKTHRAVKLRLTEQERELSDLVEELLTAWLRNERPASSGT
jgi:hypothetical protein